ncbi:MAG: hypothetical protein KBT48_08105 [Firmicutes bacterium]|nr:hypothetical protein [Bacillota bacterium]
MKTEQIRNILLIGIVILLFINGFGLYYIHTHQNVKESIIKKLPKNTWETISTPDGISSDGSPWKGLYKQGKENNLLVYFVGGGMSFDPEMDMDKEEQFFERNLWYLDQLPYYRIFSESKKNPYKDWSFIIVPYSSGDLHIGQGEYTYINEQGKEETVYHHGYTNFISLMETLKPRINSPEKLVVTGSSAGGFAAALLTEDIKEYFPETKNVTCLIDAGFLFYDSWKEAATYWNAPEHIINRIHSNNIVLDSLEQLEDVKILFVCSTRDSALQSYQRYIDHGIFMYNKEAGDTFFSNLKEMVEGIQQFENSGVYIYDFVVSEEYALTKHMVLPDLPFELLQEQISVADWLEDAIESEIYSIGTDLLEKGLTTY